MSNPISINKGIMLSGGIAGGYTLGKFAHSHHHRNLVVAGFAISGLALGYALTDLVLRKTKLQENRGGWDGIEIGIYAAGGILLLGITAIAGRFAGKK
jgi:hypothetical protein